MAKKTAIMKKSSGGALAPWQQEAAAEAKADAAKFQQGVARVSFQGGQITVDGKSAGRSIKVIIAEAVFGKAYYEKAFKPGVAQTPACYAFHPDSTNGMTPHEAAPDKQHTQCTGCPHNAFGTAISNDGSAGKGKRCKDEVRIMCCVFDQEEDDIVNAEFRMASIPPGSLKAWGQYVAKLRDMNMTFRSVVTQIDVEPFQGAYKLGFSPVGELGEKGYLAIKSKRESARNDMMNPYPVLETETVQAPRSKKANAKLR